MDPRGQDLGAEAAAGPASTQRGGAFRFRRRLRRLWPFASLLPFVLGASVLLVDGATSGFPWINYDVRVAVAGGRAILAGKVLYVDHVDNQPPHIFFFTAITEWVARLTHIPPALTFHLAVLGLAAWGLWILHRAYRRRPDLDALGFVLWAALFQANLFPFASDQFGQREHLFLVALAPYAFARLKGLSTALPIVWLAVLGFLSMQKPYFAAIVCLVEAVAGRKSPTRWREWGALTAGAVAPLILLAAFSAESYRGIGRNVIPYYMNGGYSTLAHKLSAYWRISSSPYYAGGVFHAVALLAVGLLPGAWPRWTMRQRAIILLTILGGYLSLLHQHTFWPHHFLLAYFGTTAAIAVWGDEGERTRRTRRSRAIAATTLGALSLYGVVTLSRFVADNHRDSLASKNAFGLFPIVEHYSTYVLVTPNPTDLIIPYYSKAKDVSPFPYILEWGPLMTMPPAQRQPGIEALRDQLRSAIDREKPDLVLFSPAEPFDEAKGTVHQGLVDAEFKARLAGYQVRILPPDDPAHAWYVYVRRDAKEIATR